MINVSEIVQTIKQLVEVRIELIKDEISERLSAIMTKIVILATMVIATLLMLLFASISLAFYLSELLYSTYKGFLYVAFIYLLIFVLLLFLKDAKGLLNSIKSFVAGFIFGRKSKR
ncbi:phage holin family protein [Mongoliibacter ruber]|uniref:Putative superfamily III holin-X n=1 Tax=Mongoliibacter ruber TaxID=1750599 RepID=A0A2T0WH06_9BACT|nr:phage holin family protein [Mongoliibacter ruber]PRY86000.1 putative superfamily III holin-X [Mongoliibacter ruber]